MSDQTAMPVNIHRIINEFSNVYGKKPLEVKASSIGNSHIYLTILYERDFILQEGDVWGEWHKTGDTVDLYAMLRIWVEEKTDAFGFNAARNTVFWKDGLYVNSYTMPSKNEARKFLKALNEWCGSYAEWLLGQYAPVSFGKKLTKQIRQKAQDRSRHITEAVLEILDKGRSWFAYGNTEQEQLLYMANEIDASRPVGHYCLYEMDPVTGMPPEQIGEKAS